MTEVEALKSEIESLKHQLELVNAEKIAIDQTAMDAIKQNVQLRTQLQLFKNAGDKQVAIVANLKEEIHDLKVKLDAAIPPPPMGEPLESLPS